jgi:polyphosphate kinase 2 (PPK2 family)
MKSIEIAIGLLLLAAVSMVTGFASFHSRNSASDELQPQSKPRILIVSQRTEFQEEVTKLITDHYKAKTIGTQLTGFNNLKTVKEEEWGAIVVLQSWDGAAAPSALTNLIKSAKPQEKVVVVTSSETGYEKMSGIDGITAASMKSAAPDASRKVIARIDKVLK